MQYGHECYMSHDTWTLFCKGIVALAYQASDAVRRGKGDFWTNPHADHIEVDLPCAGGEEDADGDGGGGLMDALDDGRATLRPEVVDGAAGEGAAASAAVGEQEQEQQQAVAFRAAPEHDMRTNWLHRGDREPLKSMGMYHYA
eukprot:4439621-Pyramimonas_sp.AAC.1